MWTRAELKFRAKTNIRKYFWPALAVSMINSLFNGNGGSSSSNGAHAGANISQEYNISESLNGDLGSVFSEIPQLAEEIVDSIDPVSTTVLLVGLLIGAAIALAVGTFIAPIMEVGKNRFYMESRQTGRAAGMECLIWGFKHDYLNIIWTMFVRNLIVMLGTFFFVIPGIYLAYCYHMVPYILAENPDMRTSDALRMSKDMMQGHKLRTWVLKLSFFGWWILGSLACGVGTYLVFPYYDGTLAELYAVLRNPYTNYLNGFSEDFEDSTENRYNYNNNWQQPYQDAYEKSYEYSYEQPVKTQPIVNTESTVTTEPAMDADHNEINRTEGSRVRGYYLNGVFHPYTDEELKELEKNGY